MCVVPFGMIFVERLLDNKSIINNFKNTIMKKYVCDVCGWEYDPAIGVEESGIAPGTAWEDVPADFVCPLCGVGKDEFSESQE